MRWHVVLAVAIVACSSSSTSTTATPIAKIDAGAAPVVDAAALPSVDSGNTPVQTDGGIQTLFDGADFSGWDRYLGIPTGGSTPYGLNNDPKSVFTIVQVDGEPAIHVSGEVWGALITQQEYSTYELHLEYRVGDLDVSAAQHHRQRRVMIHFD